MQGLRVDFGASGELRESDRGIDVVSQEFLSERHILLMGRSGETA